MIGGAGTMLTNGPLHTFRVESGTAGDLIVPSYVNEGRFIADGGRFNFAGGTITNSGLFQSVNGGTLFFGVPTGLVTIDNRGGRVEFFGGATSILATERFRGGTIAGDGATYVQVQGNVRFEDAVHSNNAFLYFYESSGIFSGTFRNDGRIFLGDSITYASHTHLFADGVATIEGTGFIVAATNQENFLAGTGIAPRLITGLGQTLTAPTNTRAFVDVPLTIQGVLGNDGGLWYLLHPGIVNDGLIRATNGSWASLPYTGIGGTGSWLADGGTLEFYSYAYPTTGTITVRNNGLIRVRFGPLSGSRLDLEATGTIDGFGRIQVSGPAFISGQLLGASGDEFTLAAAGGVTVQPGGTVHAIASGGLRIEGSNFENRGTIEIEDGSHLTRPGGFLTRAGSTLEVDGVFTITGVWEAESGSSVDGNGGLILCEELRVGPAAPISPPDLTDENLTFQNNAVTPAELTDGTNAVGSIAVPEPGPASFAVMGSLVFLIRLRRRARRQR